MRPFWLAVAVAAVLSTSAVAQTLTIGVRGGPDSIDPHFTATSNPPGSMIAGVCHGVPVSARFVAMVPGTAQVSGADNRTK